MKHFPPRRFSGKFHNKDSGWLKGGGGGGRGGNRSLFFQTVDIKGADSLNVYPTRLFRDLAGEETITIDNLKSG